MAEPAKREQLTDVVLQRLSSAAFGFQNLIVVDACCTLASQALALGCDTVEEAQSRARLLGEAMAGDIAANWHLITRQRKRG